MLKRLAIASLLVVFCLALLSGCAPQTAPEEDGQPIEQEGVTPIKIGHLMAKTGLFGPYGIRTARGSELAVEEINAAGGILGRPVEILYEDSEANTSVGVEKARRLIDEAEVKFIMGSVSSSVSNALAAEATAAEVVFINVGGYSPELSGPEVGSDYVFTALWNNIQVQRACARLVKDQPWEKMYNISPDYVFGHEAWEIFSEAYQELRGDNPIEIVGSDFPSFGTADFADYIAKIKAAKPDVIFSSLWATDEITFLRQGLEFGLFDEVKHYISAAAVPDEMALAFGPEGMQPFADKGVTIWAMTIYDPNWPDNEANKRFIEAYHKKFNDYPYAKTWADYAAVYLLKAGIEKAGSDNPADVAAALSGLTWENEQGTWQIRADDHMVIPEYLVGGKLQSGSFPVWTLGDIQLFPGEEVTPPPLR